MKAFLTILTFLILSGFLYGNIYFWVDESGTRHYTNIAPPTGEAVEELVESNKAFEKLTSGKNDHQKFKVMKIFDGDSLQVSAMDLVFSIRLVGIDSPEMGANGLNGQPFSREARSYLETLLIDREITLKSYGADNYHRQLAEIFLDGKNINLEIIKQGLAEVYRGAPPKTLDIQLYLKEEETARSAGKGIWRLKKTYKSPKQWRRENPRK
ncbi:MAG: thermonuclease family protein [Desulfobacula sp.]|nr:thermonuclease family protein [Desulfobacula sp.]MDA8134425.1 thermonuclease family protein [Desulfobacteraceae bacterium]